MESGPIRRREFLARLVRGAAGVALGGPVVGRAVSAFAQSAPPQAPVLLSSDDDLVRNQLGSLKTETLRRPIVLERWDVLENRRLVLAPDFGWTTEKAAVFVSAPDVTIRNVEIIGSDTWLSRWNAYEEPRSAKPGICAGMCGIRLQNAPRIRIDNVSVRGFPGAAVDGFGLYDGSIRNVTATACFFGLVTRQYAPNAGLVIERVHVRDLWGPGAGRWPGVGGAPSRLRPGGFMGSDGIVCHSLRRAVIRDCSVTGEQFASFKLVNPQDTEVSRLRGSSLMIQGTSDLQWKIDKEPSRNTRVRECVFDKSLGSGPFADEGNAIQVSWHVHDLSIERCTLLASGRDGHGIQFAVDSHGRVTNCVFDGFNGTRGVTPAHAVELADRTCSVNADVAAVNTFRNQRRILLRR